MRKSFIANYSSRLLAIAGLTVLAGMGIAGDPNVSGKFQAFGSARLVVGGVPPDNMAADLTSNCGAQPYSPTCLNNAQQFTFSGVAFVLENSKHTTLAQITTLLTDFNVNGTDCGGGSPRVVIFTASNNNYTVNLGQAPFGSNCYFGWQNTGNLTSSSDPTARWQVNLGNTFLTWSAVVGAHGGELVTEIDIVVDGGWIAPRGQDVMVDNFTINNTVMHANDAFHH